MGIRRFLVLTAAICLCPMLFAGPARAGQTAHFSLLQAAQEGSELFLFAEALDDEGLPVAGLGAEDLKVTVGAEPVPVQSFGPFADSGEGIAVLFLVDISKSLREKEFAGIRQGLSDWVAETGPADRVSVIAFGEDLRMLVDFDEGKGKAAEAVASLAPTDNLTQLYRAIMRGLEVGRRVDGDLPPRRAVVLISDGMDDTHGGATREEVVRALEKGGIPLWAVGFHSGKLTEAKKAGLSSLGELARISGGDVFLVSGEEGFSHAFKALRRRLEGSYLARLDCSRLLRTGESQRLQAVLTHGERGFTDGMDVRLVAVPVPSGGGETPQETAGADAPETTEKSDGTEDSSRAGQKGFPFIPVGGGLAALAAGALFLRSRSREGSGGEVEPAPVEGSFSDPSHEKQDRSMESREPDPVPPATGLPLKLEVVRGPGKGKVFGLNVNEPVTVGRSRKGNDLVLEGDLGVSGHHLEIFLSQGSLFVRDLRSTNGTFVNGVRIGSQQRIEEGDLLLMGGTELRVLIEL